MFKFFGKSKLKHKHKWRKTHYFSKSDGLFCLICKSHVEKCCDCGRLKCRCGEI